MGATPKWGALAAWQNGTKKSGDKFWPIHAHPQLGCSLERVLFASALISRTVDFSAHIWRPAAPVKFALGVRGSEGQISRWRRKRLEVRLYAHGMKAEPYGQAMDKSSSMKVKRHWLAIHKGNGTKAAHCPTD